MAKDEERWESKTLLHYGGTKGHVSLVYHPNHNGGWFVYHLPGVKGRRFSASTPNDVERLRNFLRATLPTAIDIRDSLTFVRSRARASH